MTFFFGRELFNLDLSVSFKTDYENLVIEVDSMRMIIEGGRETIQDDFDWFPLTTNREKRRFDFFISSSLDSHHLPLFVSSDKGLG